MDDKNDFPEAQPQNGKQLAKLMGKDQTLIREFMAAVAIADAKLEYVEMSLGRENCL